MDFVVGDARALPYDDSSSHGSAFLCNGVGHLDADAMCACFGELARVTKSGGPVLLSFRTPYALNRFLPGLVVRTLVRPRNRDESTDDGAFVHRPSARRLAALARQSGLDVVERTTARAAAAGRAAQGWSSISAGSSSWFSRGAADVRVAPPGDRVLASGSTRASPVRWRTHGRSAPTCRLHRSCAASPITTAATASSTRTTSRPWTTSCGSRSSDEASRCADQDPVVDLVAAMHARRLLSRNDPVATAEADDVIESLLPLAGVSREQANSADAITNVCDVISFEFCFEAPSEREIRGFRLALDGLGGVTVDPWPFRVPEIVGLVTAYEREGYPELLVPVVAPFEVRPRAGCRRQHLAAVVRDQHVLLDADAAQAQQ